MYVVNDCTNMVEKESKQVLLLSDDIFSLFNAVLEFSDSLSASAQEVTASAESQNTSIEIIAKELENIVLQVNKLNEKLMS